MRLARPSADWREKIDCVAMHPFWGYVVLTAVFLGFFQLIFDVGKVGEDRILSLFDALVAALARHMNPQTAVFAGVKGAVLGTAGAVAMVLPYLLPFLAGLAILEDLGYLARAGYLMDAVMHRPVFVNDLVDFRELPDFAVMKMLSAWPRRRPCEAGGRDCGRPDCKSLWRGCRRWASHRWGRRL